MKRCFLLTLCFVCLLVLNMNVLTQAAYSKLLIDGISIKNQDIDIYFDTVDSKGDFDSSDIEKNSITAALGDQTLKLKNIERFDSTNESTAYVLMADVSGSMGTKGKENIKKLFDQIVNKAKSSDKIAFVTFGNSEKVIQDFTSDKAVLTKKIDSVDTREDNTDLYRAITKGMDMLSSGNLPAKKAIIILSDGQESNDQGITQSEVLVRISQSHIPIFTVAYRSSQDKSILEGIKVLGSFARLSDGQDFELGDGSGAASDITESITSRLNNSFVAHFDGGNIRMNGQAAVISLSIKSDDNSSVSANQNIVLPVVSSKTVKPVKPEPPVTKKKSEFILLLHNPYVLGAAAIILIIIILLIIVLLRRRNKNKNNFDDDITAGGNLFDENMNSNVFENAIPDEQQVQPPQPEEIGQKFNTVPQEENMNNTQVSSKETIKILLTRLGKNIDEETYELTLGDSIIIGRDPSRAQLTFEKDELLSGKHCELIYKDHMILIRDLGSTNGTYVNGVPISEIFGLHDDDILLIGSMELRVAIYNKNEIIE